MPKSVDKQTMEALLATNTKAEIAEQFGITAKSVTRLIRQYGLPNPPYVQSEETKRRRNEAVAAARRNDPGLVARQVKGFRERAEQAKGKRWEEIYSPEKAAEMKARCRQAHLGKKGNRKPKPGPKLCALCGALLELGEGKKLQSYCKACMSDYFKAYYSQRKEHYKEITNQNRRQRIAEWKKYLAELKGQPCKDCGKIYPSFCLDFDHLELESKVADIPVMIGSNASRGRILAELAKTEVVCANCHRAREHARYLQSGKTPGHLSPRQRRNKEIIEQAKNHPCQDCGGIFSIWQMDFDHVKGDKVANVGHLAISASTEVLLAEIEKCEVVCAVCHRIRTFTRKREKRKDYA